MTTIGPPLPVRARWKLAHALWPERLRPDKVVTRWRLRACAAEAVARWQAAGGEATGRSRPEARSQNGEDALLWELVGDRENGFFVEAGAYDGYTFSVSYLFECVGWSGVLVEPLADRAEECARRRTASRVVTAALSRPGAPATAPLIRVAGAEWHSHLDSGRRGDQRRADGDATPVVSLDAVLAGHTGPIDFVVLDVEGQELAALEGFDVEHWRPSVLLVEDNSIGRDRSVRRHLERRGYTYVASLAPNALFVRSDEIGLVRRLAHFWEDIGPV